MSAGLVIELLLRGGAAGIMLIFAVLLLRSGAGFGVERLGALFAAGTAAFSVISGTSMSVTLGAFSPVLIIPAMFNSVFFWWFATALFDDDFRWRMWRLVPAGILSAFIIVRFFFAEYQDSLIDLWAHQILVIGMMMHAIYLALVHRQDDLIEQRRKFRLVFASLAGLFGLITAIVEIGLGSNVAAPWLALLQALVLFIFSFSFAVWLLRPAIIITPLSANDEPTSKGLQPEEKIILERLKKMIQEEVYLQDGLTINELASKLSFPEYKLRRLINQILGFRNFSEFLNHHRITKAREILSKPDAMNRQIANIAMDLGYGLVGSFNRAFKAAEGVTPTEYRKSALEKLT